MTDTIILNLTEDAQLSDDGGNKCYHAPAVDGQGNEYSVSWDILADWDASTTDGESGACDWHNPSSIIDEFGSNVTARCVLAPYSKK